MDRPHSTITTIRVLIVDDKPSEQSTLQHAFSGIRYFLTLVENGQDALRYLNQYQVDVVVLDSATSNPHGWETRRLIRTASTIPIVMLISAAEEESARGLDLGHEEYVVKPVRGQEVVLRVNTVLRRLHHRAVEESKRGTRPFDEGRLVINLNRKEVQGVQGAEPLTATEFKVLMCLTENPNVVVSHDQILREVWETGFARHRGNVKVQISNLRRKLESCVPERDYILSRRGHGYMFVAEPTGPVAREFADD